MSIAFYRGADCCGLVFDVSNKESFDKLSMWKNEFIKNCEVTDETKYPFVIIGNKNDEDIVVTREMVEEWIQANNLDADYVETSALTGDNVDIAFECLAKEGSKNHEDLFEPDTVVQPFEETDQQATCC